MPGGVLKIKSGVSGSFYPVTSAVMLLCGYLEMWKHFAQHSLKSFEVKPFSPPEVLRK